MNFKIALSIGVIACLRLSIAGAQSYTEEALMFSRIRVGGTARIQAMGGAQIALGGDLSLAYSNPAGLGMYNRSDVTVTPAFNTTNISSAYFGNTKDASQSTFILPHLGIAFHADQDGRKGLWGGTLGITFNRINDFNEQFSYSASNPHNSLIDYFVVDANKNGDVSQFAPGGYQYNRPTGLAYYNYLVNPQSVLNPPGPTDQYFTVVTGIPLQTETVKNTGAQNQWNLSYGVNFNDKVFLGAGLGIVSLKYSSDKQYSEQFTETGHPMSPMKLHESLSMNGTGINFTVGTIIRPITPLQIGLSIATPSAIEIEETYNAYMSTSWDSVQYANGVSSHEAFTDNVTSTYSLSTPWKISSGLAYFFQKRGFLTADVEWISYGKTRYSGGGDWSADNDIINNTYQSTFNLRFGGEYRWNNFRFRAGYSYMPDPFRTPENNVNREIISLSGGVGYRTEKFYIDLAVIRSRGDMSYRPYQLYYALDPLVTQTRKSTVVMITVGLPF